MLNFTRARENDRMILKELCKASLHGTEAFACLCVPAFPPEEHFWCGRDEKGEIRALLFENGDGCYPVFGKEFPEKFLGEKREAMIYNKKDCDAVPDVTELSNRSIAQFYELHSGLSFDNKRRYVYALHCKNNGLCRFFGIEDGGELLSVAAVTAVNEKYALIGNVFTREDKRNRGLAKKCLMKCIEYALSEEKTPFLYCKREMIDYYERTGFEKTDE